MNSLEVIVQALKSSRYLKSYKTECDKIFNIELLANGKLYSENFLRWWQCFPLEDSNQTSTYLPNASTDTSCNASNRLSFIDSLKFKKNLNKSLISFSQHNNSPIVIKTKEILKQNDVINQNVFQLTAREDGFTYLITDYLFNPVRGLEKFNQIQRKRKIWWMRISANPSRYFVDAFELSGQLQNTPTPNNCQSITIKSMFPFGTVDVEHVTLVPLQKDQLQLSKNEYKYLPAVIRSVVNLENATCAMLFDGSDHTRSDTLLINRKLAPFQCALACLHTGNYSKDLQDLCKHISFTLQRADLRVLDECTITTSCRSHLKEELRKADSIGIPYVLIIEEGSLATGFLKLHSRDTTLQETIHISDVPEYLINIFKQ